MSYTHYNTIATDCMYKWLQDIGLNTGPAAEYKQLLFEEGVSEDLLRRSSMDQLERIGITKYRHRDTIYHALELNGQSLLNAINRHTENFMCLHKKMSYVFPSLIVQPSICVRTAAPVIWLWVKVHIGALVWKDSVERNAKMVKEFQTAFKINSYPYLIALRYHNTLAVVFQMWFNVINSPLLQRVN